MIVIELEIPGSRIVNSNPWAFEAESVVHSACTALDDAAMALNLFEFQRSQPIQPVSEEQWRDDATQRREIAEQIASRAIEEGVNVDYSAISDLAEIQLKRQKWSQGKLPDAYVSRLVFIHAKSFLFAVDGIGKYLGALSEFDGVPAQVINAFDNFIAAFPQLREVRNSVAHAEDRVRGLGRRGRPLVPQPVSNQLVHAPSGGVTIQSGLRGNVFGCTMADGHYGEIPVSVDSLVAARDCIDLAIRAFDWDGFSRHLPR